MELIQVDVYCPFCVMFLLFLVNEEDYLRYRNGEGWLRIFSGILMLISVSFLFLVFVLTVGTRCFPIQTTRKKRKTTNPTIGT